jgi:hypothetical protein
VLHIPPLNEAVARRAPQAKARFVAGGVIRRALLLDVLIRNQPAARRAAQTKLLLVTRGMVGTIVPNGEALLAQRLSAARAAEATPGAFSAPVPQFIGRFSPVHSANKSTHSHFPLPISDHRFPNP